MPKIIIETKSEAGTGVFFLRHIVYLSKENLYQILVILKIVLDNKEYGHFYLDHPIFTIIMYIYSILLEFLYSFIECLICILEQVID